MHFQVTCCTCTDLIRLQQQAVWQQAGIHGDLASDTIHREEIQRRVVAHQLVVDGFLQKASKAVKTRDSVQVYAGKRCWPVLT